jgi:septum formation protein
MQGLWLGKAPLMLASQSASRQALLKAAGIPFEAVTSGVDERALEAPLLAEGASPAAIATQLARAKAKAVAAQHPGRLVLGADQTLSFAGRLFNKPATQDAARQQLGEFSGRMHELHSAFCLMRDAAIVAEALVTARLTCRPFDAAFIDRYLDAAGETVLASVGAYQIEGLGIHLFEEIDGDHASILGLPLLPLLEALRHEGVLAR